VAFAYDLLVEPIPDTDEIRCTFSALTDPDELPESAWPRDKSVPVVALPGDLTPFVIKSGGVIAFTTLPLGPVKIAVDHYLRLTRVDLEEQLRDLSNSTIDQCAVRTFMELCSPTRTVGFSRAGF